MRSAVARWQAAEASPRPQKHWFSRWAETASPPLRAENLSFTHVINPFDPASDSEHERAQLSTMHSLAHAQALAHAQVRERKKRQRHSSRAQRCVAPPVLRMRMHARGVSRKGQGEDKGQG